MRKRRTVVFLLIAMMIIQACISFCYADSNDFDLTPYITGSELKYAEAGSQNYKDITDETTNIPVDASFSLKVYYANIPSESLKENNNSVTYHLPSLFKNATITDDALLDSEGHRVGTLAISDDIITMTFTDEHLKLDKITGNFTINATADRETVNNTPNQTVTVGDKEYTLDFEKDSDSRLGTLTVEKPQPVLNEENEEGYLTYTLTLRTGDTPMKEVYVKDNVTINSQYTEEYVGVPNDGSNGTFTKSDNSLQLSNIETSDVPYEKIYTQIDNADVDVDSDTGVNHDDITDNDVAHGNVHTQSKTSTSPGTMYWYVGNMGANETRTLTYKIKLRSENNSNNNDYYGDKTTSSIVNEATPYSNGYAHESVTSTFTPRTDATVKKEAGNIVDAGQYIEIPYTITVTADQANSWTLYNLKVIDSLGTDGGNVTKNDIINIAKYQNFHLYDENGNEMNMLTDIDLPNGATENPQIYYSNTRYDPRFDGYIGNLAPGKTKTLKYTVRIDKSILGTKNGTYTMGNSADGYVYGKNNSVYDQQEIGKVNATTTFGSKIWDRKLGSEKLDNDVTQTIPDNDKLFEQNNNTWVEKEHSNLSTVIRSGSFKYQVVVNEAGDWNVSSSVFNDTFGNDHLSYEGYIQVRYYETGVSGSSDEDAVAKLETIQPTRTVWLDADEMHSFSFKPSDIGDYGAGAFLLTYYAVPSNMGSVDRTSVENNFTLSGGATYGNGTGGTSITIPGIQVKVTKVVDGNLNFEAQKYGWYYEPTAAQYFNNGQLFWIIDASGSYIPEGEQFRDTPLGASGVNNSINNAAVIGVYQGACGTGRQLADKAGNISGLSQVEGLTPLTLGTDYTWSRDDSHSPVTGTITLARDFHLTDDEHIYMVLRTVPMANWNARDQKIFRNQLGTAGPGSTAYQSRNTATLSAVRQGTNFKETASVLRKDSSGRWTKYTGGTNWATNASGNRENKIIQSYADSPGVYIDWRLKTNYAGDMDGNVIVSDYLPAGTEPIYARYFWIDSSLFSNPPVTVKIQELENNKDWEEIGLKSTPMDGSSSSKSMDMIAYYNESTREIRYKITNFRATQVLDHASLEVQILAQVTDQSALVGGKSKTYRNTMKVFNENGVELSTRTADASFQLPFSLTKTDAVINQKQIPFTIKANQSGLDLAQGSDYLTIVDELKSPLIYLPDTLKIVDGSGNTISDATSAVELDGANTVIRFKVPNMTPVTITYNARIGVDHDVKFDETNIVYWEGNSNEYSSVRKKDQSYSAGGTSDPSGNPVITVNKHDSSDSKILLEGAEFTVRNAEYDSTSGWQPSGDALLTGTTNNNGQVVFDNQSLQYNKVYAVTETKAPTGYLLDSKPVFIAAAKSENGVYPAEIDSWVNQGVIVQYGVKNVSYDAYDSRGSITLNKSFVDTSNKSITASDGTFEFGLFDSNHNQLQSLEINIKNGNISYYNIRNNKRSAVSSLIFTNVPIDQTYTVYELDREGNPVSNNAMFRASNGIEYIPTYSSNTVVLSETNKGTQEIDIQNKELKVIVPTGRNTGETYTFYVLSVSC